MRNATRAPAAFAAAGALLLAAGCGPGEPPTYDVSGTVTFGGKPVPKGMVYFEPDAAKGGQGTMGHAVVIDGRFDTKTQGKGVRGGPYNIRVSGFDGKQAHEAPYGAALFPEYQTTKEFPKEDSTLEIDVPKATPK